MSANGGDISLTKFGSIEKTDNGFIFNCNKKPEFCIDDIIGMPLLKQDIEFKVLFPFTHPESPRIKGTTNVFGVLLYGPEGNGKTMCANAIAAELNAKFYYVSPSDIICNSVEKTIAKLNALFEEASKFERVVICFEDVECLLPVERNSEIYTEFEKALISSMDDARTIFKYRNSVLIVVGCTNKPYEISTSLLENKHFRRKIHVDLPDSYTRKGLIVSKIQEHRDYIERVDFDLELVIKQFDGFSAFEICNLTERAIERVFQRQSRVLTSEDFDKVLSKAEKMVSEAKLKKISVWKKMIER